MVPVVPPASRRRKIKILIYSQSRRPGQADGKKWQGSQAARGDLGIGIKGTPVGGKYHSAT